MAPLLLASEWGISNIHCPFPAFIGCPLGDPVGKVSFEFISPDSLQRSQQGRYVSEMHMLSLK